MKKKNLKLEPLDKSATDVSSSHSSKGKYGDSGSIKKDVDTNRKDTYWKDYFKG